MDHRHVRHADDAGDRCDIADEIEIELVVEGRIDQICRRDKEERVAVRRRAHDRFGADIAATAWPVIDHEWLAEPLRQPWSDEARQDVLGAAGGNGDDQAHWPQRIRLRPSDARKDRECASTYRQTQKLSAGKFHFDPSLSDLSIRSPRRRGRATPEASQCRAPWRSSD